MCQGTKATILLGPKLADTGPGARGAPKGVALRYEIEVMKVKGEPNLFADIDLDLDARLSKEEVAAYFKGDEPKGMFVAEDSNKDGFVSWAEFTGPKGKASPLPYPKGKPLPLPKGYPKKKEQEAATDVSQPATSDPHCDKPGETTADEQQEEKEKGGEDEDKKKDGDWSEWD
jgi:hypothetical protein